MRSVITLRRELVQEFISSNRRRIDFLNESLDVNGLPFHVRKWFRRIALIVKDLSSIDVGNRMCMNQCVPFINQTIEFMRASLKRRIVHIVTTYILFQCSLESAKNYT